MAESTELRTDVGTAEELYASASKLVGLDDFGTDSDNYREALSVLLDAYQREADFTPLGSKMNRLFLRSALVARLLSQAAWKQYPQHAEVLIKAPIFVTGLVRTGTTALHRLLGADPAHQGLHMWLAEYPQPRPPRETWDANPVYRHLAAQFNQHHDEHPEYTGLHYMAADELEECWQLLRQSLHSVSYETLAHIPTYANWLSQQDWTPAYRRHRKNLQLIGLGDTDKRWVLKNPSHLFALDALMSTYPDALVVRTHRPVETIMASMCSLAQHTAAGWSQVFMGAQIGSAAIDTWSRGLAQFNAARAQYNPAQFYDVDYADFVADPLATVANIYRHFGLPLSEEARLAMTQCQAESQSGPRAAKHTYSLADYGLTTEAVRERFR